MPKAKGKNRRKKFNYTVNRKKLKRKHQKKGKPRIECEQIRNAWDDTKSVARNLAEMGLAVDPNQKMSIRRGKVLSMDVDPTEEHNTSVRKPYVLKGLQAVASLSEKSSKGISLGMIEYVRHMIESHGQNYKAMARDEKNYYQDTPKQIKKKIDLYPRHWPEEYRALLDSLKQVKNGPVVTACFRKEFFRRGGLWKQPGFERKERSPCEKIETFLFGGEDRSFSDWCIISRICRTSCAKVLVLVDIQ